MNQLNNNLVEIRDLTFSRGDRVIFNKINITIPRGKIVAIMGPSGSGKTTLLQLIGGLLRPDSGEVVVNGYNMQRLSRRELYVARRIMGLLFQNGGLFTHLDVFENVAFPMREHTDLPEDMLRDLVLIKLQAVGLRGARNLIPSQLSGGMARRVALARALALDPQLMMYDEPFTGQDPITLGVLVKLIKNLNHALGLTSIVVSHDVTETASIADYIYVIADGRLLAQGSPQEIMQDKTPQVYQFMHGLPDGAVPFHYPAVNFSEDLLC
jgi:phospholipid/cholesterol/gamma-HCH transport system ATP-binding protein